MWAALSSVCICFERSASAQELFVPGGRSGGRVPADEYALERSLSIGVLGMSGSMAVMVELSHGLRRFK